MCERQISLHSDRFFEFAALLDLKHEISAVDVLHDKVEAIHRLETGMQLDEKGRFGGQRQHVLLHQRTLNIIVLNDDVLLQNLDGVQFVGAFTFGQHHLRKMR